MTRSKERAGANRTANPGLSHQNSMGSPSRERAGANRTASPEGEANANGQRVRAFFALPLAEEAKRPLREAQARMKRAAQRSQLKVRWMDPDQLHLTLKFLGYVHPDDLPAFEALLVGVAEATPPIVTRWQGVTAFSSPGRARVVVALLDDSGAQLTELASRLESGAESLAIPAEGRRFKPHVTMARLKQPGNVTDWIERAELQPAEVCFDEARLYQSELSPRGATYTPLRVAKLER